MLVVDQNAPTARCQTHTVEAAEGFPVLEIMNKCSLLPLCSGTGCETLNFIRRLLLLLAQWGHSQLLPLKHNHRLGQSGVSV